MINVYKYLAKKEIKKTLANTFLSLILVFLAFINVVAQNDFDLFKSYSGKYDFIVIGATTSNKDDCTLSTASSAKLNLPNDIKIVGAYVYWTGSTQFVSTSPYIDDDIKINNKKIVAQKSWTESARVGNQVLHYYGAFADVSNIIVKSKVIEVSDLWWNNTSACNLNSAYGGWSIVVIYEHPANPFRVMNIYDGLKFVGANKTIIHKLNNVKIQSCDAKARLSLLTWDADIDVNEDLFFDNQLIASNEVGGSNADFDFNTFQIPQGEYSPDALIKVGNDNLDDRFITQLVIVDYEFCNEDCNLFVPPDTTISCETGIDQSLNENVSATCDMNISFEDIIIGSCPKTIQRTWIGKPKIPAECRERTLVFYPLDCISFEAITCDVGGMKPILNSNICPQISASPFCRIEGKNSCVYRANDPLILGAKPDAICAAGWNNSEWKSKDPTAFTFSVSFENDEVGCLTSLSFYEVIKLYTLSSDSAHVNFPRNFGLVVYKNGTEIFRDIARSTSQEWTLQEFRFDDMGGFCYDKNDTYTFEIQAFNAQYNLFTSIWEIDDVALKGCCNSPVYEQQIITLEDNTPPTIDCNNIVSELSCNGEELSKQFIGWHNDNLKVFSDCVTDACANVKISSNFNIENISVDCGNTGSLSVTYIFTDDCMNSSELEIIASIIDLNRPIVQCKDINYQVTKDPDNSIDINMVDNGSFDNCGDLASLELVVPEISPGDCGNTITGKLIGIDDCGLSDTCSFNVIPMCFDLALRKQLREGQELAVGTEVIFDISIINQGNIAATAVSIIDYLPEGISLVSPGWTDNIDNNNVTFVSSEILEPSNTLNIELIGFIDRVVAVGGELINVAEISSAVAEENYLAIDIDSEYDTIASNDLILDDAIDNEEGDEDDHDVANIEIQYLDLALEKSVTIDTSLAGDNITFVFTLINEGFITGYNVEIIDYLPEGLTVVDSEGWEVGGSNAVFTLDSISPRDEIEFELTLSTESNLSSGVYINAGEIRKVTNREGMDITDIDSKFDQDPENDEPGEDDFSTAEFLVINCVLELADHKIILPLCPGGLEGGVDITIMGGESPISFIWSDGSTVEDLSNVGPGEYGVTITDVFGCSIVEQFEITDPDGINCTIEIKSDFFGFGVSKNGATDGELNVLINGGTQPYAINWNTGLADTTILDLAAGTYTVSVTDASGCICISEVELTEPQPLSCGIASLNPISCPGEEDASIIFEVRGGIEPYQILWSTGDTLDQLDGLSVGIYSVTVTDQFGDICFSEFEILPASPISASASSEPENCINKNGLIELTISGGKEPYNFLWNNGDTIASPSNLSSGNYSVTITDANGCTFNLDQLVLNIECAGIGNFVWKDVNENGIQDEGEPGVNGILVVLRDAITQVIIDTFVTTHNESLGTDGYYFFENVEAGIYQIVFLKENTFVFTISNAGDAKIDSDADLKTGVSFSFQVGPGELLESIDAGLVLYSYIGNFVWFDENADGIQDDNESGIPDVKLYLFEDDGSILDSTLTDQNGYYIFNRLDSGNYTIGIVEPLEFNDSEIDLTLLQSGDNDSFDSDFDPSTNSSRIIEIGNCTQVKDIDAGFKIKGQEFYNEKDKVSSYNSISTLIYPNPSADFLNIDLHLKVWTKEVSFNLIDIQGKLVRNWKVAVLPEDRLLKLKVDISNLMPGLYYLQIIRDSRLENVGFEILR